MIPAHPTETPPQSGEATTLYRNPAAERQRPPEAHQIESGRKRGCAAPVHSHTVAER